MPKVSFKVGDVSVYPRGAFWHCFFWTPAGRQRKTLRTTNRRTAERKARRIDELLSREAWDELEAFGEEQKQATTFEDFIRQHFLPKYADWAPTTLSANTGRIRKLCVEWGRRPLSSLTSRDIKTYLSRLNADGLSQATQNRYLAILKAVYNAGTNYGHCSNNPAASVRMRREAQTIPAALTENQVDSLLLASSDLLRPLVTVAVDTGLRKAELFSLTWADVDLEDGKLTVGRSKNGYFRIVWLTNRAREVLVAVRQSQQGRKVICLRVFPFKDVRRQLQSAAKRAGLPHVHMHQFRHTFATRLRDRGVPLDRIKELLGHRTMQMVLRYAKARPEQTREAVAALNR